MAFTYQDVVDLARIPLNDEDKDRVKDSNLLTFANHGVMELVKRRPDLFIGQYQTLPTGQNALTDTFPLDAQYVQLVADYVTARASSVDDEFINSGRAALFMQLFNGEAQP